MGKRKEITSVVAEGKCTDVIMPKNELMEGNRRLTDFLRLHGNQRLVNEVVRLSIELFKNGLYLVAGKFASINSPPSGVMITLGVYAPIFITNGRGFKKEVGSVFAYQKIPPYAATALCDLEAVIAQKEHFELRISYDSLLFDLNTDEARAAAKTNVIRMGSGIAGEEKIKEISRRIDGIDGFYGFRALIGVDGLEAMSIITSSVLKNPEAAPPLYVYIKRNGGQPELCAGTQKDFDKDILLPEGIKRAPQSAP
ncbi:MAG: hypothetical protein AB1468_03665 [Candidatus Micrarchaeota archaeon]